LLVKISTFSHISEINLREAFERLGAEFSVSLCYIIVNNGFEGI